MSAYKYETHFHTDETSRCGKVRAGEAVRMYHSAGYTGIIVTDHYTDNFFEMYPHESWDKKIDLFLAGYKNALLEGQRLGMDILLGMEIRFTENENDYLVYGFDTCFLHKYEKLYELGLRKFRELTADMGIVIVQAHPFRPYMVPAPPQLIDGIETYNGNPRHDSANHLAAQYACDNGLKTLSGSDFHQPQDLAKGGIIVGERIGAEGFARIFMNNLILNYIQE